MGDKIQFWAPPTLAGSSGVDGDLTPQMKMLARLWNPPIRVTGIAPVTLLELWNVLRIPTHEVIQARRAFNVQYARGWVGVVSIRSRKRFKRYLRARRPDLLELLEALKAFYMLHPVITVNWAPVQRPDQYIPHVGYVRYFGCDTAQVK